MKRMRMYCPATELRVASEDGKPKITGYAAVFNKLSEELWENTREMIAPGAFTNALNRPDDVRALWNHDPNYVLGRNTSGTLLLSEDEQGLKVDITPPETQWASDLVESIRRGDVSQMSFGFIPKKESWEDKDDGSRVYTVEDVQLFDVSPVTYPAYPDTEVAVRRLLFDSHTHDETEENDDREAGDRARARVRLSLKKRHFDLHR